MHSKQLKSYQKLLANTLTEFITVLCTNEKPTNKQNNKKTQNILMINTNNNLPV